MLNRRQRCKCQYAPAAVGVEADSVAVLVASHAELSVLEVHAFATSKVAVSSALPYRPQHNRYP